MIASSITNSLQQNPLPIPKARLLLVSDSHERLKALQAELRHDDMEITEVSALEDLATACCDRHDIVAIDAGPSLLDSMLKLIRGNPEYASVPVLVEASRLDDRSRPGMLPLYRAMPCSFPEMQRLVRRHSVPGYLELPRSSML